MKDVERYDKLAMILFRLECGVSLLDVIYECISCDKNTTDIFAPAIYAAYEYFFDVSKSLKQLKEEEFPL